MDHKIEGKDSICLQAGSEYSGPLKMSNSTEPSASLYYSETTPAQNQLEIVAVAPSNEERNANQFDHRFQRTDQWMPVYSWLESLDTDEVVKSKDILDWLNNNAEIREQLYSRHSRYHLMHYIKKCHVKILKRKDKNKVAQATSKVHSETVPKVGETRAPVPVQHMGNILSSLPQDNDIYKAKRKEALQKYEILVELEKQLLCLFPSHNNGAT